MRKRFTLMGFIVLISILFVPLVGVAQDNPQERSEILETVLSKMENEANDTAFNAEECFSKLVKRGISACDKHAAIFVDKEDRDRFEKRTDGSYSGVGMNVLMEDDEVILNPFSGSPADSAGIEEGDALLRVNSTSILNNYSLDEIVDLITGPAGTEVSLTVMRGDSVKSPIRIERANIQVSFVDGDTVTSDIGYVKIQGFNETFRQDFESEINELLNRQVEALIIDVRYNSGGRLWQTIKTLNDFFSPRRGTPIISISSQGKVENEYAANRKGVYIYFPTVVLTNRYSASAAEIMAGVMQSWNVATVVGDTTFGKGSVQDIFRDTTSFGQPFMYKFTTAEYLIGPDQKPVEEIGVIPDTTISDLEIGRGAVPRVGDLEFELSNDPQLRKAIDILKNKIN